MKDYEGLFNGELYIGKIIDTIKKIDIVYDEDEELYFIKRVEGISFEADANNQYIECITVYSLK